MKRYVYAFDSGLAAQKVIKSLHCAKIDEDQISLIARPDIQEQTIPANYLDATTDFAPAVMRGAVIGCATSLVAGVVATFVPALDVASAGPMLFAFLAIAGTLLGAWSSAIVGSSVPDTIRRKFDDEIEAGRVLLIVDSDDTSNRGIRQILFRTSIRHLLWQCDVSAQKF